MGLSRLLPAEMISMLMILHCTLNLISDLSQKRQLNLMTPYYAGVILAMIANIVMLNRIEIYGISETFMYGYIDLESVSEATLVLCLGNSAIFMGYELFTKTSFPSICVEIQNQRTIRHLFTFIVVFTLMHVTGYGIDMAIFGGGVQKVFSLLIVVGIMFFARLWAAEDSKTYRGYAIFLCLMQTVIALYGSFLRSELLTPVMALAVGYFIGKGNVRYALSYRMIPLIAVLAIFSLFFQNLGGNRSHFIDAFKESNNADKTNTSYLVVQETDKDNGLLLRNANIAQVSRVVKLVKENGHYKGTASAPLLAAFIPRFIWPDKPIVQLGAWYALEIGVATELEDGRANNSVNMTIPGELYLDFGWIGLFIGCFFFGSLMAAFWNAAQFMDSPYNISGTLWGGYLLLYALAGIGPDLQIVISLTSTYIVFLIIRKILQRNENTRLRAALAGK